MNTADKVQKTITNKHSKRNNTLNTENKTKQNKANIYSWPFTKRIATQKVTRKKHSFVRDNTLFVHLTLNESCRETKKKPQMQWWTRRKKTQTPVFSVHFLFIVINECVRHIYDVSSAESVFKISRQICCYCCWFRVKCVQTM